MTLEEAKKQIGKKVIYFGKNCGKIVKVRQIEGDIILIETDKNLVVNIEIVKIIEDKNEVNHNS